MLRPPCLPACLPARLQVHKEPLGSLEQEGYTCVMPRHAGGASAAAAVDVNVQRGYGPAEAHATPAEGCQLMTRRTAGAWAVPEGDRIAALRVSGALAGGVRGEG